MTTTTTTANRLPRRLLGEVLVDGAFISATDLDHALSHQRETNERLGETLVRLGKLTRMELDAVLATQVGDDLPVEEALERASGVRHRLGDLLLKSGKVRKADLETALHEQQRTNEKLGEVLVRLGHVSAGELEALLTWQSDASQQSALAVKLMLGEILVSTKVISRRDLEKALAQQKLTRKQIGEILLEAGLVRPNHLAEALKIQSKLFTATLVAVMAAGTLTGCGAVAPGVPGTLSTGTFAGVANGTAVPYTKAAPVQTMQIQATGARVTRYQNGSVLVDDVPFIEQNARDNTCGQAASTLLLNYWGVSTSYQQVVNESNRMNLGTSPSSAVGYLKSKGLDVKAYRNGSVDFIKSMIDQGRPAMVVLDYEGAVHWVVVVGYNETTKRMLIHDSIGGPYQAMTEGTFMRRWQNDTMSGIPVVGGDNWKGMVIDASRGA
ncbi:MAG: C39 family peptidase [bacterium]|nr:C39 family peptidase [bacterium]